MNTIQKLVTIGDDGNLIWHQKGSWVSPTGNTITIDPDAGIDRNGIPIGGGGTGPIPPILTPDKVVLTDGDKTATLTGQDGLVVTKTPGGTTTVTDTGVKISAGGSLGIGTATLGAPLLAMLQGTHNTSTGNLVLGTTKSLQVGDQSLTRTGLVALNSGIPSQLGVLDNKVTTLEGTVSGLTPLTGKVAALEGTVASHETRISALEATDGTFGGRLDDVELGLDAETTRVTALIGRVDTVEATSSAGIATLTTSVGALDTEVQFFTSKVTAVEGVANDATTAAATAQNAADAAQNDATAALAAATTAGNSATAALAAATTASSDATAAKGDATAALTAANAAQGDATAALTAANTAQGDATTALSAANTAQGDATAAQSAASAAQGDATTALANAATALSAATAAQGDATAALATATTASDNATAAKGDATAALNAATGADAKATAAQADIVIMKGVDTAFDGRITALENSSGGAPVVLPFYAKTANIDFGAGNTFINEANVTLGDTGKVSLGAAGAVSLDSTGNLELGANGNIACGQASLSKTGLLSLGAGGGILSGDGTSISTGTASAFAFGDSSNLTFGSAGTIDMGVGGTISINSSSMGEAGVTAARLLGDAAQVVPGANHRVLLYNPTATPRMDYSSLPLTSFANPTWVEATRGFFPDAVLGDTIFQKSILTLDGSQLLKAGVDAVAEIVAGVAVPYTNNLDFLVKDATGAIKKTTLPSYLGATGIDFGAGATIDSVGAETVGNLAALPGDGASANYVVYNTGTKKYGYTPKPSFVDTVNNVVGNMGNTGDSTEAYLGRKGLTFGSATLFEPLENTCYGDTALTVVDRTQGTVGQRRRAEFGANGITLSNPLATSIDNPATITLDRAKLALLQRIATSDVISTPDAAATTTQRALVGDKVSGVFSYVTVPTVPDYVKPTSLVMGPDPGDITIGKTSVTATAAGVTTLLNTTGLVVSSAAATTTLNTNYVGNTKGTLSVNVYGDYIAFKNGASNTYLTKVDVDSLKANFTGAANAATITDVDSGGDIRFLTGPAIGTAAKKWLAVPKSYAWLGNNDITASKTVSNLVETGKFEATGATFSKVDGGNPYGATSVAIGNNQVKVDSYNFSAIYGPSGPVLSLSGAPDPVYGSGAKTLAYRAAGAAIELGKNVDTVFANPGVDYLTVAKNTGTRVEYNYQKVGDVLPVMNGAVIEPKRNPAAIIAPSIGSAKPAVLDAGGLSFPLDGNPLADGATSAPHDGTTYNSDFVRIGNFGPGLDTLVLQKHMIQLYDNMSDPPKVHIDKNRIEIGTATDSASMSNIGLAFFSDALSTEFPGSSSIGYIHTKMVNSIYTNMASLSTGKKYTMMVDNTTITKQFYYPQYVSPGFYHRFPLSAPNGLATSADTINLFSVGNTTSGVYNDTGVLKANFNTFKGNLKVIPFSTSTKLFLDLNFTDGVAYVAASSTRYLFLSNNFTTTDTLKFIRYHRHSTEAASQDTKTFALSIVPCTIVQTNTANNFVQMMMRIIAPTGSTFRGVLEIVVERPSIYDPVVPDNVVSTK